MQRFWKFWDVFGWMLGPFVIGWIVATVFEYVRDWQFRSNIIGFTVLFTYIWAKGDDGKFGSQQR